MKRRYEKFEKDIICFFIFLILIILFALFLINEKIVLYKLFNGVVYDKNTLVLVLNNNDISIFEKNRILYINSKKEKFKIKKINQDILKRNNKSYNQVFIKVNFSNKYKVNDIVEISIMDKSVNSYNIFKVIGGLINENNE